MSDKKENHNNENTTLTVKPGTLGLSKAPSKLGVPSPSQIKRPTSGQPTHHGKGTVVVVTKTKSSSKTEPLSQSPTEDLDSLSHEEIERRLKLIRTAEAQKRIDIEKHKEIEALNKQHQLIENEKKNKEDQLRSEEALSKLKEQEQELERRNKELKDILTNKGKVKNLNSIGISQSKGNLSSGYNVADEKNAGDLKTKTDDTRQTDKKAKPLIATTTTKRKSKEEEEEEKAAVTPKKADDNRRTNKKISVAQVMMMDQEEGTFRRSRSLASIKRAREKAKRQFDVHKEKEKVFREVILPDFISVQELANRMTEKASDVIKALMKLGMIVTLNQSIDADTAELIVNEFGHTIKRVTAEEIEKSLLSEKEDDPITLMPRPPVVTVMGHVDHGKTSLLDSLRSTDIATGEAGGITQHIGAYQVKLANGSYITFLDTPGHEAFTAMRSRGAKVTDIVILVVAADDGIMQQTVEAINHAKAANVPIIIAINKIDKPEADPKRVKNELLSHGLVPEEMGGEIITVEVSAKKKINLEKLEEAILLQAEMLALKANPNRLAKGVIIEAQIDKGRGAVATLLVQKGSLKSGDFIVAGTAYGKIRALINDKGQKIDIAGPSLPVEVLGLNEAPTAGDDFVVTSTEKLAKDIAEFRINQQKDKALVSSRKASLEQLFLKAKSSLSFQEFHIIIKADVQGSVEAISNSLTKLSNEEIQAKVLHSGVGGITESDITLANASNAFIIGFNVRANTQARDLAKKLGVEIRYYSIIYNLVDDVKSAMSGMLAPTVKENFLGYAEIKQVFDLSKFGKVAGSYVTEGIIKRQGHARLIRDSVVIYDGKLKALKRFKEDIKEVKAGFECGISFENYEDIKPGDKIEAYELIEESRTL